MHSDYFIVDSYLIFSDFGQTWPAQALVASSNTYQGLSIEHIVAQTIISGQDLHLSPACFTIGSFVNLASHSFKFSSILFSFKIV